MKHENIVTCGDKNHIKKNGVYRFGVKFYSPGDGFDINIGEIRSSTDQAFADFLWKGKERDIFQISMLGDFLEKKINIQKHQFN